MSSSSAKEASKESSSEKSANSQKKCGCSKY
jgi:hypothetical protein